MKQAISGFESIMADREKIEWYADHAYVRPQINWFRTVVALIASIVGSGVVGGTLAVILKANWQITVGAVMETIILFSVKRIAIWGIKAYQRYAPLVIRSRCCFTPSCSEYALLAIEKYGIIRGCKMAVDRLLRCHPPGGVDYP